VARDHVSDRVGSVGPWFRPGVEDRILRRLNPITGELPVRQVMLAAFHYPRSGNGFLWLTAHEQFRDPATPEDAEAMRGGVVSQAPLGPFDCDLTVTTFAVHWVRQVARMTDWATLDATAHALRTRSEVARGVPPRRSG